MRIVNGFVLKIIVSCLYVAYNKPIEPKQCTIKIGNTLVQGDAIND